MFRVERHGERVSILRMDDGKVNVIGPAFVREFPAAWAEATAEGRAVVIAGNPKAFCAGLDLKTLPGLERAEMIEFAGAFMRVFRDILAYERPVVAAVDGPALAGGAIIALGADFRLVTPRARLGLTEIVVGIPFPPPVAELARRKLPPQEHAPAVLQSAIRDGEACVATGWAHRLLPSEAVLAEALALAEDLAQRHPPAYTSGKQSLNGDLPDQFAGFAKEADRWVDVILREDTATAIFEYFMRATAKK